MDIEQGFIIKFLRFKRMKLLDIHHELTFAFAFGKEVYILASVKY
jgi:hypothetical protein